MNNLREIQKMKLFLLMVAMSFATSALADWFAKTPEEDAMCQARIYAGHDTSDKDNWRHMHHYCDCLRFINRAYVARDRYDREHALQVGVGGCNYVLNATKPDFFMRAEVMTQMAIGQKMLGQRAQAAGTLIKAINFDPNYVPAYMELSDYYREVGDKKKALELAVEGLKREPDSKRLKRQYKELGGKEPYPAPIVADKPSEEAKVAVQPEAKGGTHAEIKDGTSSVVNGAAAAPEPGTATPEPPKIGSPTNPYCRFCPD